MSSHIAKFSATVPWFVALHRQHAVTPAELLRRLLVTQPNAVLEALLANAVHHLIDMVASGRLDKSTVLHAAEEIVSERSPHDHAAMLAASSSDIDAVEQREQSAVARWIDQRGCDPVALIDALVESGALTMRQVREAAGEG